MEKKPTNKFKRISNANYVIVLGKQLKFSLVGIGGTDIVDGNKKLVLAFTWSGAYPPFYLLLTFNGRNARQLMRHHIIKFLTTLGGGVVMSDEKIIQWANEKVDIRRSSLFMLLKSMETVG